MPNNLVAHLDRSSAAMRCIDRVGWSGGLSFTSYGWRIGIRTNEPTLVDRLPPLLPPDWAPLEEAVVDVLASLWVGREAAGLGKVHHLYIGSDRITRTADLDYLLDTLESELQLYVAEHARERIFVHAGVVGCKGRALLLPGRSMAGKSTLVEALVRAGATYYSDEYAVLDASGQVYPYARRLSLRQRKGLPPLPPRRCTAHDLGGEHGAGPLPVSLVAVTKYQEGARWEPRRLAPGQAFLELMSHTIPAQTYPERVLSALQKVAPRARILKSWRGEAEETATTLLRELEIVQPFAPFTL